MRIKQLHVTRYGPMTPFENNDLGVFTLIHGSNERGKTLLIDALVRMLFKKQLRKTVRRDFGNMNRVAENPEGFVVLESKGTEHKLEARESLSDVFPFATVPRDFRNIFVVRDSDLSLRDEKRYYSRVAEKLTGLRSSEIEKLMSVIQRRGRLRSSSPDSDLANNAEQGKIADKVKDARGLVDEIREVKESLLADKFDELENELITVRDRLESLEREARLQKAAEETKRIQKANRALRDLMRMRRTLDGLEQLDADQLKQWQKAISRREGLDADIAEEKKEIEDIERVVRSAKKRLAAQEAKTAESRKRLDKIETDLKPKIDEYQYERAEYSRSEPQSGTYRTGLLVASGIVAIALIGYFIKPSPFVAAVGSAALMVWLFLGYKQIKLRSEEGSLRNRMARLDTESKRCGLDLESVDEVISSIDDLENTVRSDEAETQADKTELDSLFNERRRIETRIQNKSEQIAELNAEIVSFKASLRMESIGDYQAALERRTKLEATAEAKETILLDILPIEAKGEAAIAEWDRQIDAQLRSAAERDQVKYDAKAIKRIETDTESLVERKRQIQSALLQGSRKLHSIEVKAKELGVLGSSPPCRSTLELDHISTLIEEFCEHIDRKQRIAQEAIRLCLEIDAEERKRVSSLFGPDSQISTRIAEITGGRYDTVHYDPEYNQIYLTGDDDDRVPADSLSGGTWDQLYMAIRVSIAEQLLEDEKGFLVLDDPFVKADEERLGRMMTVLRRLVAEGWQILYFSAKEEVKRALEKDIEDGNVRLIELRATGPAGKDVTPQTAGASGAVDPSENEKPGEPGEKMEKTRAPEETGAGIVDTRTPGEDEKETGEPHASDQTPTDGDRLFG